MDSGEPSERTKRQLLSDGLGICAEPDCNNRIDRQRTRLGECAHIIPRKVGSHPREDYKTSLEDRKKEANLLYLCETHHPIVDNSEHAELYTAKVLREWKQKHEEWGKNVKKNSPYIPAELKKRMGGLFDSFEKQIAQQNDAAAAIIETLLDTCHDLLFHNRNSEAQILLAQIDLLLLDSADSKLKTRAEMLDARVLIRNEQIPLAKTALLRIIQENPTAVDAMLEYVELCHNVPEVGDRGAEIEQTVRKLVSDHSRLTLLDLIKNVERGEKPEGEIVFQQWAKDPYLNSRFLWQYVLVFHANGEKERCSDFIERGEKEFFASPRPHLFRFLFTVDDLVRSGKADKESLRQAMELSKQERKAIEAKDPLTIRDQISWQAQDLLLEYLYCHKTGADKDLCPLRNQIISLILKCYFDKFTDKILSDVLGGFRLDREQWLGVLQQIKRSKVLPSKLLVAELFMQGIQYENVKKEFADFVDNSDQGDLRELLQALNDKDAKKSAELINNRKDPKFSLILAQSLQDKKFALQLIDLLDVGPENIGERTYARLDILNQKQMDEEAIALVQTLDLTNAAPSALHTIEQIATRSKRWDVFIPVALLLLKFDIPDGYKRELNAKLGVAYHNQGDDTNALLYAEKALEEADALGIKNAQNLLHVITQSLLLKGLPDQACDAFEKYHIIKRSLSLALQETEAYCRSKKPDKYDRALAIIVKAYEESGEHSDNIYAAGFPLLNELANSKKIPLKNEDTVEEGTFIKLEGLEGDWFYLGAAENAMGATPLAPSSDNYKAVVGNRHANEILWPSDEFTSPGKTRKILNVLAPPAYLNERAHEALGNLAKLGNSAVWAVRVIKDDGSLDMENLKKFFEKRFAPTNEFFELYCTSVIPFAFLCRMEGGITKAIGRVLSSDKAFIRCNDGSQKSIDKQSKAAKEVLEGKPCCMDGLSALMLADTELLEIVIKTIPHLYVPTSVIRLLRKIAEDFTPTKGTVGRGGFVDGSFKIHKQDADRERSFSDKLLNAANLLDALPNKVTGKVYSSGTADDKRIDNAIPSYLEDSYRIAQENNCHVLTDDDFLVRAHKMMGEHNSAPQNFSSHSLVREMANRGLLAWNDYLKYFHVLAANRYHLLPFSVDDLMKSVFPVSSGGLVSFEPKNILLFNLDLTLSADYGIADNTAAGVLANFFSKIILDDTIPESAAEEVFSIAIVKALAKRDAKLLGNTIYQICQKNASSVWETQLCKRKLDILQKQLSRFAEDFDPIVRAVPGLLKNANS